MLKLKLLFVIWFTYCGQLLSAQINDSDKTSLITPNDSLKIETLLEDVWIKRSNDPLNAIKIAKLAYSIAENSDFKSLLAKIDNYLGVIYTNIGANEVALDYHFDALKRSREYSNKIQEAYSCNNIGGIYRIKNEFVPASENILSAIDIFENLKDSTGLAYCFINMGRLYKDQSNFSNSLQYFNNALEISNNLNNSDLKARILLEIADILFQKGQNDEAENTYLSLEKLYEKTNYQKGLAEVRSGLSLLHYREKEYSEALNYSNNSLELNRKILNTDGEINNLNSIALIYLSLNQKDTGIKFLSMSLKKAIEINEPDILLKTYNTNYEFYKKLGNYNKALEFHEKYHTLRDSVYTNEELLKFSELESILRVEKAEKGNQILQHNLDHQITQRNYLLVFIFIAMLFVGILTFRFVEKKKLNIELKKSNKVKDKFFSIIAHDLREPYNAIFSAVELLRNNYDSLSEIEKKETIESIGKLIKSDYDLLENLLIWAHNQNNFIEFLPVNLNAKDIIEKIISLFKINLERKKIIIKTNCNEELSVFADEQMLNTILRNLIFNAIKFSKYGGEINVSVSNIDNQIQFIIEDKGIGMNKERINNLFEIGSRNSIHGTAGESGSGLGLILTKEFVEQHSGTITVESKINEGSKFIFTLPL